MPSYRGKHVFVSGGSSGIGLACACAFAARGANLFIFARDVQRLERAVAQIRQAAVSPQQRIDRVSLDVTDGPAVQETLSRVAADFGRPDVLINSAGRARPHRFEQISREMFDRTLKANLYGTWNVIAALVPHMLRGASIVNVGSITSFVGVFGYSDYSASKFAVMGLSEALRSELKPRGITVCVLCPPDTDTPGFVVENRTKPEETRAISANARLMSAEAVAAAMIHGMEKRRAVIVPGIDGKLTFWAKRLLPGLVQRVMDRQIQTIQRRSAPKFSSGK